MEGRPLMPTYTQGDLSKRLLLSIGVVLWTDSLCRLHEFSVLEE